MIPSFIAHFGNLYPGSKAVSRRPRGLSHPISYADSRTWHLQDDWCNIQWHNAKHIYLYSIEIQTQRQLQIPVTISYPDIHWQYMLKGAYSLWNTCGPIPVLSEGYKHLIRGEQGHYTMEVAKGRHWIIGFNVAARWLERYPEHLAVGTDRVPHVLAPDRLYHSTPIPIIDLDRAELYYLLGLSPSRHILQDSQLYLPIAKLVEQMEGISASLSPIKAKTEAIRHYIKQRIDMNKDIPSIATLADRFDIDKDYLGRKHRSLHQETLATYIFDLKLDRAVALLAENIPINDISHLLGYSHSAAFRKAFIKKYEVCPSEYRKRKS